MEQHALGTTDAREGEGQRPARLEIVPVLGDPDVCPVGRVKVGYCPANISRDPA